MRVTSGSKSTRHNRRVAEALLMKQRSTVQWALLGSTSIGLFTTALAQAPAIAPAPMPGAAQPPLQAPVNTAPAALPETAGALAVPAPAANNAAAQDRPLVSLQFEDADVATLVRMIAEQSKVQIIINGDVTGKIGFIQLTDVEPEVAIQRVALAGNLQWRKLDQDTYIIAKELPKEPEKAAAPATPEVPAYIPGLNSGPTMVPMPNLQGLPELAPQGEVDATEGPREYRYVRVRNVKASMMAWWIEPEKHPEPLEYATSRQNLENYFQKYVGKPALDPAVQAAMNGNAAAPSGAGYYNPYAPAANAAAVAGGLNQFAQPYVQDNAQFGGGFGGGGGFGDRPPRRDFGGGGGGFGAPRSFGDRPPRRDFGGRDEGGPTYAVGGTVKWFDQVRGFGFVTPDDGGQDVFLHSSVLQRAGKQDVQQGEKLSLEVRDGQRGRQAVVLKGE
jgi:cold shock CspA family protein